MIRVSRRRIVITLAVSLLFVACGPGQIPRRGHLSPQQVVTADGFRLAAALGDIDGVEAALKAGLDVNVRSVVGTTALMAAAGDQHVGVVRLLLSRGADPHAKDADGHDAYWHAMRLTVSGRVPFSGYHFDMYLPRVIRSESAALLSAAMKQR